MAALWPQVVGRGVSGPRLLTGGGKGGVPCSPAHLMAEKDKDAIRLTSWCGECNVCTRRSIRSDGQLVRCIMAVAAETGAEGHHGACLTGMGAKANGSRIEVYWPLEDEWFSGTVASFCPRSAQHTIEYDDGDVECSCLLGRLVRECGQCDI